MRAIKVRNDSGSTVVWCGKEFTPNEEYNVPTDNNRSKWQNNVDFSQAVLSGDAKIGDGGVFFDDANEGLQWLLGTNALQAEITTISAGTTPSWSGSRLCYEDMGTSSGGVSRNTSIGNSSWVRLYSYQGSGQLTNIQMVLEDIDEWYIRLVVDSNELFGTSGISTEDMDSDSKYALEFGSQNEFASLFAGINLGLGKDDTFFWGGPLGYPVQFNSSVEVYVKRTDNSSKKFRAGLVVINKD